jgi:hypothetical protein
VCAAVLDLVQHDLQPLLLRLGQHLRMRGGHGDRASGS